MKTKIARGLLYVSVLGLAIICISAIIDNYELAIIKGITSTTSCYNTESFDTTSGQIRPIEQCDQYNPQFVFFGSILLLIIDAVMFYFFNRIIASNAPLARAFEKELRDLNALGEEDKEENRFGDETKKLVI